MAQSYSTLNVSEDSYIRQSENLAVICGAGLGDLTSVLPGTNIFMLQDECNVMHNFLSSKTPPALIKQICNVHRRLTRSKQNVRTQLALLRRHIQQNFSK